MARYVAAWPTGSRSMRALGIDGVSMGSNDLTQLMLGVDRDSEVCAELFDESDPAVLDAIARVIGACHEAGITSSPCGQVPRTVPTSPSIWSASVEMSAADTAEILRGIARQLEGRTSRTARLSAAK